MPAAPDGTALPLAGSGMPSQPAPALCDAPLLWAFRRRGLRPVTRETVRSACGVWI